MQFGPKSEKLNREIEQLELKLEELEAGRAQAASSAVPMVASAVNRAAQRARQPLPEHLRRETRKVLPQQETCPDCGGTLKPLGEDISEMLEWVPEHFKVIREVRPKLACACCDKIVQAGAASRPIERGMAGPGLLAHVLVSKYCDHLWAQTAFLPPFGLPQAFAINGSGFWFCSDLAFSGSQIYSIEGYWG